MSTAGIRRGYVDGPFGQIHYRMMGPVRKAAHPTLVCMHPSPFSGLAFITIMPYLADGRRVLAPDFPSYGGSDPFRVDATIGEYAEAVKALVDQLASAGPVDLMGFHTGCLVALELARLSPARVRRLALVDVPAFDAASRAKLLVSHGAPFEITPELSCLAGAWETGMTSRVEAQGLDASFAMFAEQLRAGRARNAGFHACFNYDVERHLPTIKHETLVVASQSGLLEPSRRAAGLIPGARLVERTDITRSVLDEAAEKTAGEVLAFLS